MRIRALSRRVAEAATAGTVLLAGTVAAVAAPPAPKCLSSAEFQVVYREKADSVGSDILVQRLDGKPRKCAFEKKAGDFRVGDGADDADYVLGLGGNVLVLDQGTGPDRNLQLFDLTARKVLLSQGYDDNEKVKIEPGKVSFRAVTGPAKSPGPNCPDFKSYIANGLEVALTQGAQVSLPDGKMTLSGKVGCIPQQ